MERKTRFELATFSLARRCSTTEPLPHYNYVPRGRIELPTPAFSVLCSTTELPRRLDYFTKFNLLGIYDLWARQGSNLRPIGYEPTALPLSYGPLSTNKLNIEKHQQDYCTSNNLTTLSNIRLATSYLLIKGTSSVSPD